VPHVLLVMEKSPELVPVIATLLIATAAVVVLLKLLSATCCLNRRPCWKTSSWPDSRSRPRLRLCR